MHFDFFVFVQLFLKMILFSSLQKFQLSFDKLSGDYEKLKKEEMDKSSRLQEMTYVFMKKL